MDVEKLLEYELKYGQTGKSASGPRSSMTVNGAVRVSGLGKV